MSVVEATSGADILFALNPHTSRWAERGFTAHSNWWIWDALGLTPEQADPTCTPQLDDAALAALAANHIHEPGGWETLDTSRVTTMAGLFRNATGFNAPVAGWDTSNVTYMQHTFHNAVTFNQSLANWDITNVEEMDHMFAGSGISTENLSATLVGWARHATTKTAQNYVLLYGLPHSFTLLTDEAQQAVNTLCNKHGWRINFEKP